MSRSVRTSVKAPGRWEDADTGDVLPEGWHIGRLAPGDTYARRDGVTWKVHEVRRDPLSGGWIVTAHTANPKPQRLASGGGRGHAR